MSFGRKIQFPEVSDEQNPALKARPIEFTNPDISRLRSLLSALPKGLIKGQGAESLLPRTGPIPQKTGERLTEQFLPTHDRIPENILERTGKILRSTVGSGGNLVGTAARSLLGGTIGEGIKETGGGEGAQIAGEISAFGLPGFGRKIVPTKAQEKLIDYARRTGMSEKQISPLIPTAAKKNFFGKVASKGSKTQKAVSSSRQGVGKAYDFVKNTPDASKKLSPQSAEKFLRDSAKIAYDMPSGVRHQLKHDAEDLLRGGLTGKNLINFYQDIGDKYKLGREQLERLKGPITEAMESISPQLSEDFTLTNDLFKKRIGIGKTLKPNISSELLDLGELGKLVHSITQFSLKGIGELLGITTARRFAREMLINPRLQNITKQMQKAVIEHKFPVAIELAKYIKRKYQEEDQSPHVIKQ